MKLRFTCDHIRHPIFTDFSGVCCPRHVGVDGNDWADSPVSEATMKGGLHPRRSELLRSLRCYLLAVHQGHCAISLLQERAWKRQNSVLLTVVYIGTVPKATLRKHLPCFRAIYFKATLQEFLRFGMKRIQAFWNTYMSWTELSWSVQCAVQYKLKLASRFNTKGAYIWCVGVITVKMCIIYLHWKSIPMCVVADRQAFQKL